MNFKLMQDLEEVEIVISFKKKNSHKKKRSHNETSFNLENILISLR
jgi:hypothetical protein